MKKTLILLLTMSCTGILMANEDPPQLIKKADWYQHFDQRLNKLEARLLTDMEAVQQNQRSVKRCPT
jgi:tetrahydromethanopterin S-methyltransferase subunit G